MRLIRAELNSFAHTSGHAYNGVHERRAVQCANSERRRIAMILCPIAIAVTCKKCPAFSVCPLKGVIGDYRKQEETQTKRQADNEKEEVQPD